MQITKTMGGTALLRGETVACRETWTFDAGKQGTARISIRVEPCSEEQRARNRAALDDAVRLMARCQSRNLPVSPI